ncbi:MAG: MFS transporter [Gammaproteobacteria bacterium]|nr:MAG: MFS transporter [Gammaproteobacteria bacterium]UCH41880.1 MAG: MFS transporter [Gammaproteobacteria bacterium]
MKEREKSQLAWAFYDWANSSFAVVIMAGFFPLFFKEYWAASLERTVSTFWLGVVNSSASLLIVVLAPLLGAMADHIGRRKTFLLALALIGIVMTGCLSLVQQGEWQLAIICYLIASVGFMGANVFYDALLMTVSGTDGQESDRVSALGFALGYLGGGLLFALCVLMTQQPQWFGLADSAIAVKLSFVLVALWWALFSLPILIVVREPQATRERTVALFSTAAGRIWQTLRELKQLRQAVIFLAAYWLYIDGVGTVIRMAIDYGISIGFSSAQLIIAMLITQFIGFPATFLYGRATRYFDVRIGIFFGIAVYSLVTVWGSLMQSVWEFYLLAVVIGLVQGGVQALSRSLYSRLIPEHRAAELYGFYNMVGKSAAVIGPVMMGWLGVLTGSPRVAILSLLILFLGGFLLLLRVRVPAKAEA